MPELPEVEVVRRGIAEAALGRRVLGARLFRSDFLEVVAEDTRGEPAPRDVTQERTTQGPRMMGGALLLEGMRIARVERHGKQIAVCAEDGAGRASRVTRYMDAGFGPCLVVQLGMSGEVIVERSGENHSRATERTAHVHAQWELDDGSRVLFRDPRRFGGLTWLAGPEQLRERWGALGPDALAIVGEQLAAGLGRTARAIKAALLDQRVLAGVGNIYADEALFRAGIGPRRRADRLGPDEVERLAAAIRAVLAEAVGAGGSTIQGYRDPSGQAGSYQRSHLVYGRAGESCVRCGQRLRQSTIAQRTTVWCPRCQSGAARGRSGRRGG
ncbi:MAG: Fpg/Nei family DNA glycosylase [Phycisphaerales bacterium]